MHKTKKQEENWLSAQAFIILGIVFVVTQSFGLLIAKLLINLGAAQPIFGESVNDISNALYLIATILVMTTIIVIALRYRKKRSFLWWIEAAALFVTGMVVFSALFPWSDLLALGIPLLLIIWRYTHRESVWFRNLVGIIAIVGAGALLGISLGMLPVVVFVIILAIYDIIAVFGTKHMITIGKAVTKQNFAFTISLPTKKHTFELGNGDMVIPLMVASSIIANGFFTNNYLVASLCLGASFIGLMTSIYLVAKKQFAMPALPPQTLLMLIIIGVAMMIGL